MEDTESATASFTVELATPTIEGPAQGSVINPNDPNLDGDPLTGSASENEDTTLMSTSTTNAN